MNFTLCVLLVYNDARYAKCLHRSTVFINQQNTKGEIHFINNIVRQVVNRALQLKGTLLWPINEIVQRILINMLPGLL